MNGPGSIPGSEAEAPTLVRRYVERVLPPGGRLPRRVRIRQTSQMWRKPGGRRLPFTSVEEFAVEEVAFSWRARFPVLPLVSMRVLDGYAGGGGTARGATVRRAVHAGRRARNGGGRGDQIHVRA